MARIDSFLRLVVQQQASDLHFNAGNVPIIRHDRELIPLPFRSISDDEARRFLMEILTPEQRSTFEKEEDLDFAYVLEGHGRFSGHVFTQSRGIGAGFRIIPDRLPTIEKLHLLPIVRKLGEASKGSRFW